MITQGKPVDSIIQYQLHKKSEGESIDNTPFLLIAHYDSENNVMYINDSDIIYITTENPYVIKVGFEGFDGYYIGLGSAYSGLNSDMYGRYYCMTHGFSEIVTEPGYVVTLLLFDDSQLFLYDSVSYDGEGNPFIQYFQFTHNSELERWDESR